MGTNNFFVEQGLSLGEKQFSWCGGWGKKKEKKKIVMIGKLV